MHPMKTFLVLCSICLLGCIGSEEPTSKVSASEGGQVDFFSHQVLIPPFALDQDTEVRLRLVSTSQFEELDVEGFVVVLEPEGLQLSVPAEVMLRFEGSEALVKQRTQSSSGPASWTELPHARVEEGIVRAPINTFEPIMVAPR